jgi:sulfite reductase (NADPH) flavoprotein alpha-component
MQATTLLTLRAKPSYSRETPFFAQLIERRRLSKGQHKAIWHLVINLKDSGYVYKSGDSLGVFPSNNPQLIEALLKALNWTGNEAIILPNATQPIESYELLLKQYSLTQLSRKLLEWLATHATDSAEKAALQHLINPEAVEITKDYLQTHDLLDLVLAFPKTCQSIAPQAYFSQLRKLLPRLYSIASSPLIHNHEAHLTISTVRYIFKDRAREGVASTYLIERIPLNESVLPVFMAPSHFRLPEDATTPIIMIGPGTGVAPFRAFIQERSTHEVRGKSWLFFGEQHQAYDFLYEEEWLHYQKTGILSKLDLAFSRDQDFKVYVQHKMKEQGAEVWKWLSEGAHIYVCGDAQRMAKDVDVSLHQIIATHGNLSTIEAAEYVKKLKAQKRYQRDVY